MDWVIEYVKSNDLSLKVIPPINHMRIYKQMFLPYELVGMEGESKTAEFKNEGAKSSFR